MRRVVTSLLAVALVLAGCGAKPLARPPAPHAVFELVRTRGAANDATLLVVDTASAAVVDSIPLGPVIAVSDVVTATGVPRLVIASADGFREFDFDTRHADLIAAPTAGMRPAGVGHTGDGNPVVWQVGADGALVEVFEIAGATVRVARADLRVPAAGAPQDAERRVGGRLMLMAADAAQAVFVDARSVPQTGSAFGCTVFRADFHAESFVQLAPTGSWPAELPPYEQVRVEEAVRRWGVPAVDSRGPGFFGLDGVRRAVIEDVTFTGPDPGIVFQPGGETLLAVERASATATRPIADVPFRLVQRSMYGEVPRTLLARSSGPLVPVGVAEGLVAYTRRPPGALGGTFELRMSRAGDATETVATSTPLAAGEGMRAVYLGTYEPR